MIFEQRCEVGADEPTDIRIWKAFAQNGKGRQGQDYVTQRTGLYYQDVPEIVRHRQ
jgi:hypothetical protein